MYVIKQFLLKCLEEVIHNLGIQSIVLRSISKITADPQRSHSELNLNFFVNRWIQDFYETISKQFEKDELDRHVIFFKLIIY